MKNNKEIRFKKNPFITGDVIPVKNRQVSLYRNSDKKILVDTITGEVNSTHVVKYKEVDADEFVKLFTKNIALMFELTATGIKAFTVLMFAVQKRAIGKDKIQFGRSVLREFKEEMKMHLTESTFNRGIAELVKNHIIAKTIDKGEYFINPYIVFNGDRITLTNIIQKKKSLPSLNLYRKEQD